MPDEVPLQEYIRAILDEREKRWEEWFKHVDDKFDELDPEFSRLNDLRREVITDRALYATKEGLEALVNRLDERAISLQERTDKLATVVESNSQNILKTLNDRIIPLEQSAVSQEALRAYKRVVYTALFAAGVSIVIALINTFRSV